MDKLIEFRNMNFAYNGSNAFNDFNMEILKGDIVTLIGTSGSGKTTLLKMLCHKLPNGAVYYKGNKLASHDIETLKREIVVVFDDDIRSENVFEEIVKYVKKLSFSEEEIEKRYEEIRSIFELDSFSKKEINRLTKEEETLVKILRFLIVIPQFLAVDNILTRLSQKNKNKVFSYIKKYHITFLNVTTDLEDSLYGNKLCVLDNFVLILEGNTTSVLKTDTLLKRLGFRLPVIVELSIELNHYDVLKKIYTDRKKLVNALWK